MTLVLDTEMTRDEAERLSSRIGLRLDTMADNWAGALPLIREAIERNAFSALGYASHGAYVSDRFGDSLAKLGMELRREIVRELTDAGLSTRAIAPVFGVSHKTIVKDRQAADVVPEVPPADSESFDPTPTLAPRDDDWSPTDVPGLNPITGEVHEAGDVQTVTETHTVKVVTGLDGKKYEQTPKEPRRSSLVDDARNAGWQLRKAIERLQRIESDDRYRKNKVEITAALQPHLDFANEVISGLNTTTELEN